MELRCGELTLRPVTHDDLAEVARTWKFGKGEIPLEEAAQAIDWMQANHRQNRPGKIVHACFAVLDGDNNRIIGWCGLDSRNGRQNNLFYMIDKDHRRLGFATKCAQAVLNYGFLTMGLDRIDGECALDNLGSQKVLEKLGMTKIQSAEQSLHYYMTHDGYIATHGSEQMPGTRRPH
ncbi:MAG: GNAT family N-acetyltransferase [Bacillota bacterium]